LPRPWKDLGLALLTALVVLVLAVPAASAAMTHSQVSVARTYDFFNEDALTPPVRHITATSDGSMGESVDILCLRGADVNALGAPISTTLGDGGALAYDIPESSLKNDRCRLALVPDGQATADPVVFAGPTVGGGYFNLFTDGDKRYGFDVEHAYARAYTDFFDLGDCGLCDMALLRADNTQGTYLFFDNAYLSGTHAEPGGGTRADIVIDGKRAYTPYEADRTKTGWLGLTVMHTQDPDSGDMTYIEEEPLLFCQPDDATCSSYAATPIHWKRTVVQNHEGRMVWIADQLSNTDAAANHDFDLDFEEYQATSGHSGFRFPGQGSYVNHVQNDVVSSDFGPVSTIGFVFDTTDGTTDEDNPLGTLTVSPQPVRAWFGAPFGFNLQFKGTIPPGGMRTIRQVFSMGVSQGEVDAYAAQAVGDLGARLAGPAVAITDPAADGSTVNTQTVTVRGTASDDVGVTSLKVNGAAVSVAGDGTWSAPVTLAEGANTITAFAQDAEGNDATATRTLTYAKSATTTPPPATAPPPVAAISKNGKVKVTRNGKKIVVDTGIKVTCPAGATACTAAVSAKTIKAVAAKLRKRKITIAKKTFTILAGKTRKIVLTLSSKGVRALKLNKKLKVKVAVAAKVGTGYAVTATRTITLRYPKRTG